MEGIEYNTHEESSGENNDETCIIADNIETEIDMSNISFNPPRITLESMRIKKPESNYIEEDVIIGKPKKKRKTHINKKSYRIYRSIPIIIDSNETEPGFEEVVTDYGTYTIPIYANMSPEKLLECRNTYILKFDALNDTWKTSIGKTFAVPTNEETMKIIHIRFEQSISYIKAKNGVSMYLMILYLSSLAAEMCIGYAGIDADGFTLCQWRIMDVYESQFIKMGEQRGFGNTWSPLTTVLMISAINITVFILINMITGGDKEKASNLAHTAISVFTGGIKTNKVNELGIPIPNDDIVSTIVSNVGIGDLANGLLGTFASSDVSNLNPVFRG